MENNITKYAACTLYENHYHYGVAVLINSLYAKGYKGKFYIGYRGSLPPWVIESFSNQNQNEDEENYFRVNENLILIFIKLNTSIHFSNFKPQFMKTVCSRDPEIDAIYYFDPDIVIYESWTLFLEWINSGVAVCEDINSPLEKYHPKRVKWRELYSKKGESLIFKNSIYVNGGFLGLHKDDFYFLDNWIKSLEILAPYIGGLEKASFKGVNYLDLDFRNDYFPFSKTDQDALNIAIELYQGNISYIGKEGMSFASGPRIMSHALGEKKPWLISPFLEMIKGITPRIVDKDFWRFVESPLKIYSKYFLKWRRFELKLSSLIGRFYSRN